MVVRLDKTIRILIDGDSQSGLYVTHSNFLGISCPKHIAFVRGGGKST